MITLPAVGTVECETSAVGLGLAYVQWAGKTYTMNFQDLLDGLSTADAARADGRGFRRMPPDSRQAKHQWKF